MSKISFRFYKDHEVRAIWDEENAKWWFSVQDVVGAINDQFDYKKNRNYWKYLKTKLRKEGNELVSGTNQLKLRAADGKLYDTDVLDAEGIRLLAKTDFQKHIQDCYQALKVENPNELCFLSQKKTVFSTQRLNIKLKEINKKYRLGVKNMSNHSLRKCFGRRIFDMASETSKELCLIKLGQCFNHSDVSITKRYLGLKTKEILECYDLLTF